MPVGAFYGGGGWSAGKSSPNTNSSGSGSSGAQLYASGPRGGDFNTHTVDGGAASGISPRAGGASTATSGGAVVLPPASPGFFSTQQQPSNLLYQPGKAPATPMPGLGGPGYGTNTPWSSAMTLANTLYGPDMIQNQMSGANLQDQMARLIWESTHGKDAAKTNAATDLAKLDLQAALARGDLSDIPKLRALLGEDRANRLQQLVTDEKKARDNASRSIWDLRSDLTGRGAFNTIANERGTGRVNRDLGYNLAGINTQRTDVGINYRKGMIGYDAQERQLRNTLQQIGLSKQEVNNHLQQALDSMGIGAYFDARSIGNAITSNNAQAVGIGNQILQYVSSMTGIPISVLMQYTSGQAGGNAAKGVTGGKHQNAARGEAR